MFNIKNIYQALSILILIIYVSYLIFFSLNIPQHEDYANVLNFLIRYVESDSTSTAISLFFDSTQEHVNVTAKLLTTLIYSTTGFIDLRGLVLFGNLCLILFIYFFNTSINTKNDYMKWISFLLLLNIMPFGINTWGLTSIQHFCTTLLVFLAIKSALNPELKSNLIAISLAILATGTFGNGIIVFVVIISYRILIKDYKYLSIWIISFLVIIVTYYFLVSGLKAKHIMYYNPLGIIHYTLNLYGSILSFNPSLVVVFGIFVISFYFYFLSKNIKALIRKEPILLMLIFFVNLSMLMIIVSRSHISPYHALIANYKFISLLNVLLLINLIYRFSSFKRKKNLIISFSVAIYVLSIVIYLPKAYKKKNNLVKSFNNIENSKNKFWHKPAVIKKCEELKITNFERQ